MNSPEATPRLLDDTVKCFAHLVRNFDLEELRELLVTFCGPNGAKRVTVNQWFNNAEEWPEGKSMPGGENLLRLRCFLDLSGYGVTELNDLSRTAREVTYLIALGLVKAKTVLERLEYAHAQQLWNILLHGATITKKEVMEQIINEEVDRLPLMISLWRARIREVLASAPQAVAAKPQQPDQQPDIARLTAQLILATSNLAQAALEADLGPEVRSLTRDGTAIEILIGHLEELADLTEDDSDSPRSAPGVSSPD